MLLLIAKDFMMIMKHTLMQLDYYKFMIMNLKDAFVLMKILTLKQMDNAIVMQDFILIIAMEFV